MSDLEQRLRESAEAAYEWDGTDPKLVRYLGTDLAEAADTLAAVRGRIDRYGNGDGTTPIEALNDVNQILGDSK